MASLGLATAGANGSRVARLERFRVSPLDYSYLISIYS